MRWENDKSFEEAYRLLLDHIPAANKNPSIYIRFENDDAEAQGLGVLAKQFSFRTWRTGVTIIPPSALVFLEQRGVPYARCTADVEKLFSVLASNSQAEIEAKRNVVPRDATLGRFIQEQRSKYNLILWTV